MNGLLAESFPPTLALTFSPLVVPSVVAVLLFPPVEAAELVALGRNPAARDAPPGRNPPGRNPPDAGDSFLGELARVVEFVGDDEGTDCFNFARNSSSALIRAAFSSSSLR